MLILSYFWAYDQKYFPDFSKEGMMFNHFPSLASLYVFYLFVLVNEYLCLYISSFSIILFVYLALYLFVCMCGSAGVYEGQAEILIK